MIVRNAYRQIEPRASAASNRQIDTALLANISRFMADHKMPETLFGRMAVEDPRLVSDLRKGRELRRATIARIETFMRDFV